MAEQSLGLEKTDPELEAMMKGYIYGDIMEQARLTRREQHLVTIATLTASGAQDLLEKNVRGALTDGVTPLDVREAIYHLAPYIGFPKVLTAMERVNRVFKEEGVKLPLENQAATTDGDRLEKGLAFQVATYGERIVTMRKTRQLTKNICRMTCRPFVLAIFTRAEVWILRHGKCSRSQRSAPLAMTNRSLNPMCGAILRQELRKTK